MSGKCKIVTKRAQENQQVVNTSPVTKAYHAGISMWQALFFSPDREKDYRLSQLQWDKKQAVISLSITTFILMLFAQSDIAFFGFDPPFSRMLAARLTLLGITIPVVLMITRSNTPILIDRLLLFWTLSAGAMILFTVIYRPPGYHYHALTDMLYLLSLYFIFPNRFLFQVVPAMVFTTSCLINLFFFKDPMPGHLKFAMIISYMAANACGMYFSWRQHISHRTQFFMFLSEHELTAKLQQALDEIKTLRGIIPICMHCKKLRDDQGYWSQLEEYLSEHTHAALSHGYCPECAKELFPDVFDEDNEDVA